jgi:subtilisin family serine protease
MQFKDTDDRLQAIQEHQLRLIQAAHPEIAVTGADGGGPREPGQPFGILFRDGEVIVRADVADDVLRFLRDRDQQAEIAETGPLLAATSGATRPPEQAGGAAKGDSIDLDRAQEMAGLVPSVIQLSGCEPVRTVPQLCRLVRDEFGPDDDGFPAASPHHVFYMTPHRVLCPATEPAEVTRDDRVYPDMRDDKAGYGTSVAVLDTGFIPAAAAHCSWLRGISDYDPDPLDKFDLAHLTDTPDGYIDPYTGHGTFIAGVIRRIAPAAGVHVRRLDIDLRKIFTSWPTYAADIVDEMHLPDHVRGAVWSGQKVISLSAGGPTLDNLPPLSFRGVRQVLERSDAVLVSAAGNDSSSDPFWPAAFDWTVGVGALDAARTGVASFSNLGVNSDVYAPGTDIVNAFACGDYECFQPPDTGTIRHFHGLTKWSGTSFSTPVVAGLVAARMATTGETAPAAMAALLAVASTTHVLAGVGPTLAPEYTDLGI